MSIALQAILASMFSSLLGLGGGFILLANHEGIRRISRYLVSFAAGALLGAAFFDLLPEAIEEFPEQISLLMTWLMGGFLLFFLIEKLLLWHHHSHGDEIREEGTVLSTLIIVGDALHNLIDGVIIGATFLVNPAIGYTTALAVLAHEIPQEIGDFSILIHSGMKRRLIAWWNVLGAMISPLATGMTILLADRIAGFELPLLGLAAGAFIYIAAADLVPEIHQERKGHRIWIDLGLLILGILAIVAVGALFPHAPAE